MGGAGEVAIVGMACVMPGAPDVETFWANIVDGVDSVTEVPASRWDQSRHYDPDHDGGAANGGGLHEPMSVSKWGGFVPEVGFDALAWGIPPASLASIDPAQLLALKVATGALADAGYGPGGARELDREHTSVIYATGSGGASELPAGFMLRLLLRSHGITAGDLPPELSAHLPQLTEDGLPGVLTSVIAGRVANRLDLGGKNLIVDSACASALVALDIACNELRGRSSDVVLCGGVDLHNGLVDYVSFTAAQALARSGRCRAFDVDADGMTLAEGCGCLVLKRLEDAERDGDRIYALVQGVAGSSDGRHLGLTAPRQEGQMRAVRRAYEVTGVSPAEIGMVEAHGTGTPTGDRTELLTTTEIFAEAGAAPGSVVIGSVKSNIGHTKCASGIASLIKAAKSAYHGVQPPTLHIRTPIEEWDPATSPFVFLDRARPWLDERRMVAVSSFGFGGTNFHAILENHRAAAGQPVGSGRPHWPSELFAFHAADDAALGRRLEELSDRLAEELVPPRQADRWRLRDVAAAESASGNEPLRLVVVADDLDDLAAKVAAARAGRSPRGVYRPTSGPVGVRLPDAESVRPGMVADLAVAFGAARSVLDDPGLTERMWPRQAFGDEGERQRGALAEVAEPAVAAARATVTAALAALGVTATAGEISADVPGEHGITTLLHAVAQLAMAGVDVDLDALHAGRGSEPERWTSPSRKPGWIVDGHYARAASGDSLPKGLHPADEAPVVRFANGTPEPAPAPVAPVNGNGSSLSDADLAVVTEYLRIVQGMVATGTEIVRGHVEAGPS